MIEQLRIDMIAAFRIYNEKFGEFREQDWDRYCRARENYLREHAKLTRSPYRPLKDLIDRGEGNN